MTIARRPYRRALIEKVKPETAAALAIAAREEMKLRHAPLLLVARDGASAGAPGRWSRIRSPA